VAAGMQQEPLLSAEDVAEPVSRSTPAGDASRHPLAMHQPTEPSSPS